MPRNYVQRAFSLWFKKNRIRFKHQPIQIRYMRGSVRFFFTDVIHEISVTINKSGCVIAFTYQNELLDLLVCFDISVERDRNGYYCGQCTRGNGENTGKRYPDREDLLADHVFEPLRNWSNERVTYGVVAKIFLAEKGGSTWVSLVSKEQVRRERNDESLCVREKFLTEFKNDVLVMDVMQPVLSTEQKRIDNAKSACLHGSKRETAALTAML